MENLKPLATPGHHSPLIHLIPTAMYHTTSNESSIASFSKDETVSSVKHSNGLAPPAFGMLQVAGNVGNSDNCTNEQDPFLNVSQDEKNGNIRKLSPTATPFEPRASSNASSIFMPQAIPITPKNRILEAPGPSSLASGKTSKEVETPRTIRTTEGIFDYVFPSGDFASGRHTRYLSITGIPENLTTNSIKVLIKGKTYRAPVTMAEGRGQDRRTLLAFSNIIDSVNAAGEIPNKHSTWSTDFTNARAFSEALLPGSGIYTSIHKGQLAVTATRRGSRNDFSEHEIVECVKGIMKNYGPLLAWEVLQADPPIIYIRMEYYDVRDSEKAKASLHGSVFGPLELSVKDYAPDVPIQPDIIKPQPVAITTTTEDDLNTMVDALTFDNTGYNIPDVLKTARGYLNTTSSDISAASDRTFTTHNHLASSGRLITAPTPYSSSSSHGYLPSSGRLITDPTPYSSGFPTANGHGFGPGNSLASLGFLPIPEAPRSAVGTSYRNKRPSKLNFLGGNNVVNLFRITHGQDVRTTIMLRNIPNKMPQAELKQWIDETNHGEYDFMYLRIDFANNCNVGYAFINFVDPLAIVKFVKVRAGTKWLRHLSDKVAEISYATIQGRDCLIQKFRNSSVMLEDPSFRPKLFHVGPGPMAGKEETFPGPDNDSKLRRSIENAGAVGLFAPRAGQFFRESQRRRRSQFDRGTHLAQIEESSFVPGRGSGPREQVIGTPTGSQSAPAHHSTF